MAKDLTTMPTEKLWKRARAALDEIERRMEGAIAALPSHSRHIVETGTMPQASRYTAGSPEATLQRRLTRPHLPKPDPAYLAAFERTRPREPAPQAPIDTEGMTAPGPSEPAE